VLFCVWFSIRILRLLSVTVGDPLAGEDAQADTLAVGGIQEDPLAMKEGTQGDTMVVEGTQVDTPAVEGILVDTLAGEGTQVDTMAMEGTQGLITQGIITTVRRIIPVGTAGVGMGIIPAVIGGVIGTMLIRVGGGLIRMGIHIPMTTLITIILILIPIQIIPIPTPITILIPIPIPIICLRRRALWEAIKPGSFPNSINLKSYNIQLSREKAGSFDSAFLILTF
jgi:hypothetical protein